MRAAGAAAAQHGEAVDGDPGLHRPLARQRQRHPAPAVGTVGRDIDHQPLALERVALDLALGEVDHAADALRPKASRGWCA